MRGRSKLGEGVLFYALFALFGLGCLAWSLCAAVLHRVLPRQAGIRLGRAAVTGLMRRFVDLSQVAGLVECDLGDLDALAGQGPLIVAPNHPSMFDAVLILSRLPGVACVTKATLWDSPFLGGGVRLAGYIRNDSAVGLVKATARELRGGGRVLIFPEGSRTAEGEDLSDLKGGFALVARMTGTPVQTVLLETNTGFLGKGWPFFKRPRFPLRYRARLGRRFSVEGDLPGFLGELKAYYADALARRDEGSP
ncbi:MAG: 1-acyl-sn-glycerol-3-phosphate acyltransferase [Geminicoccaceae bacterium]|nr:1-acyl-sn-glycerol-3-phosphate acyltransferase [Geminicoccaceae bacterium]